MATTESKIEMLNACIGEAEKFIKRAKAWETRLTEDRYAIFGSKEGGACKRVSMDLTRILAQLRKH